MRHPIEIVIVDRHPGIRRSMRACVEAEPGLRVAAETGDLFDALPLAARVGASIAIVDSGLASLADPVALDALQRLADRVAVIVTGMGDPDLYVKPYVAAGASGYWPKFGDAAELTHELRAVASPHKAAA